MAMAEAHKREPLLWIDRYCLHSTEAEVGGDSRSALAHKSQLYSLGQASAMMPVFIAGCQNFVSLGCYAFCIVLSYLGFEHASLSLQCPSTFRCIRFRSLAGSRCLG